MKTTNYCAVAGISILFLIGCLMHLKENDVFSLKTTSKFRWLIYVLMFEISIDCVFVLLEGKAVSSSALYIIKALEFAINPVTAFLVFDIFYNKKVTRQDKAMLWIRNFMLLAIAVNLVLQLSVFFGVKVFIIDEQNFYQRGPLIYIYIAVLFLMILGLISGMLVFSSKIQSTMKTTLMAFAIIIVSSLVIRYLLPNNNYDFLCLSAAVPFLLVYYSHVTLRVDPLTKLLNRQVYQRIVERVNYTTIIIMIDANNFKQINDNYGHEVGDRTLKQLAQLICEAYSRYGYCFRIGGDEFCVILKPEAFDRLIEEIPHRDAYYMAEQFMGRLDEIILRHANADGSDGCLQYGVSQGYGIFYSSASHPSLKERMPLKDVIKVADKRMYSDKVRFRKEHPELSKVPKTNSTRARVRYKPSATILVHPEDGAEE